MKRRRQGARTPDGDLVGFCGGCGFAPIRASQLRDCPRCHEPRCRVCIDQEEGGCLCKVVAA